ncbi:MAG: hypothetical protein Q7U16_12535 [Agitococcus sp.]|nr:hypothetical protein [Agitococcus sp.]
MRTFKVSYYSYGGRVCHTEVEVCDDKAEDDARLKAIATDYGPEDDVKEIFEIEEVFHSIKTTN